jgi:transposase
MGHGYSSDLRVRIIGAIEGGTSCRAAARQFGVRPSTSMGPSRVWGRPIEWGLAGQMFHQRWIRNGAGFALDEEWDRHAFA